MSPDEQFEEKIAAFVSAGNTVIGRPSRVLGVCSIHEYKSGSTIVFGNGCTISNSTFQFPWGGGTVEIGEGATYQARTHAAPNSVIKVGEKTVFNRRSEVHAWEDANITIGKNCLISNIRIRTSDMHTIYDARSGRRINDARSVVIEDRVWIGEDVMIAKGARVGAGSIVGALSLVTGYIPNNCIAVGVPARVMRRGVKWKRQLGEPAPKPAALPPRAPLWKLVGRKLKRIIKRSISGKTGRPSR